MTDSGATRLTVILLLTSITENPPVLPRCEGRKRFLSSPLGRTLFDLLREQADRFADSRAVIDFNRSMSYRHLLERARCVGSAVRHAGVVRWDRVGAIISIR